MNWPEDYKEWFDLGDELRVTAIRIIGTVEVKYSRPNGLNDPVVYAATLLFRTLQSCKATYFLATSNDIVEANIIARSCVENVLWLRGLQQRGLDFVQDILGDGMRAEAALAELLLKMPNIDLGPEAQKIAMEQIKGKLKTRIETSKITASEAAAMDYSVFRMISNSYAHPSTRSLDCYVTHSPQNGYELQIEPNPTPRNLLWTLFVAASAALTAVGLFLETFPLEEHERFNQLGHGNALRDLSDRLQEYGRKEGLAGPPEQNEAAK